jgi:hypothetical protein
LHEQIGEFFQFLAVRISCEYSHIDTNAPEDGYLQGEDARNVEGFEWVAFDEEP